MTSQSFAIDPARLKYFSGEDPRGNQSLREMHRHRNLQSGLERRMKRNEKRDPTPAVVGGAGLAAAGAATQNKKVSNKIADEITLRRPKKTSNEMTWGAKTPHPWAKIHRNVRLGGKGAIAAGALSTAAGAFSHFNKPVKRKQLDTEQRRLWAEQQRTERRVQRHVAGIRRKDKYAKSAPVEKGLPSALKKKRKLILSGKETPMTDVEHARMYQWEQGKLAAGRISQERKLRDRGTQMMEEGSRGTLGQAYANHQGRTAYKGASRARGLADAHIAEGKRAKKAIQNYVVEQAAKKNKVKIPAQRGSIPTQRVGKGLGAAMKARKAKKLDLKYGPKSSSGLNGQAGQMKIDRGKKPFGVS